VIIEKSPCANNKKSGGMMMKKISTTEAPAAIGPYSQGMILGDLVFSSGQIPVIPSTGEIAGSTITEQAEQSCKNVAAVLAAGGSSMEQVVKTTCFLADMGDFPAFNSVYEKYFVSLPARSCVAVKDLPKGVLCEIEAIASLK
jgi:2-iminobutanoate/2-iminopropanoate deaminase